MAEVEGDDGEEAVAGFGGEEVALDGLEVDVVAGGAEKAPEEASFALGVLDDGCGVGEGGDEEGGENDGEDNGGDESPAYPFTSYTGGAFAGGLGGAVALEGAEVLGVALLPRFGLLLHEEAADSGGSHGKQFNWNALEH